MHKVSIPKASGGVRQIVVPSATEKAVLREKLPELNRAQAPLTAAHGFMLGRNVVTNALPHVGAWVTINLDLKDFFDSCTLEMAKQRLVPNSVVECGAAFLNKEGQPLVSSLARGKDFAARQGLPTSPGIANICARPLDEAIVRFLKGKTKREIVTSGRPKLRVDEHGQALMPPYSYAAYTRYADDLSISYFSEVTQEKIEETIAKVKEIAKRCGFAVNPKKVRVHRAAGGRREICGVVVDDAIHPTRRHRRELRAALHNIRQHWTSLKEERLRGLAGWCNVSVPRKDENARVQVKAARRIDKRWRAAEKLARQHGLCELRREWLKKKVISEGRFGQVRITNDPVDFLRMGWVHYPDSTEWSCMKLHRDGGYNRGVVFWLAMPGVSMAVINGEGRFLARVLLYQDRDGKRWYSRAYGDTKELCAALTGKLRELGYTSLSMAGDYNRTVVGSVLSALPKPFFDYGATTRFITTSGISKIKVEF